MSVSKDIGRSFLRNQLALIRLPRIGISNPLKTGIIMSYELELTSSVNQPEFFRSLYQESKQIDDNITPQFVQDQLKKLMDEGKFCTSKLFGIVKSLSKQDEVKSMVLNSIKSKLVADVDNANEDYNVNSDSLSKQERLDLRKNISRSTASSSSDGKGNQ
jgi:hypothetical protein